MAGTPLLLAKGILVVVLFVAAGNPVVCGSQSLRSRPLYSRWAYAYLFGIIGVCSSLFAASQWFSVPLRKVQIGSLLTFLALCGVAAEVFRHRILRSEDAPSRNPAQTRCIGWLLVLAIVIPAAALLAHSAIEPARDIDGRNTWIPKARYIREAGTVLPEVLRDKRWVVAHPRYPPLMPLAQIVALEATGGNDERVIRSVYAAFWLVWILIILDQSRELAGRSAAYLSSALAVSIPFAAFAFNGGAAGAYSDLPLACFWGAGVLLLLDGCNGRGSPFAAGLLLSGAVLTKNEGLALAGLALVGGFKLCIGTRGTLSRRLGCLVPVLMAFALLGSWKSMIPNRRDEAYFARLSWESIAEGLTRLSTEGLPVALHQMMNLQSWSLFWVVLPLLLVLGAKGLKEKTAVVVFLMVAGGLTQFLVAYLITGWDLTDLVRVTWNRALIQVSVPLLALAAVAVRSVPWRESLSYRFFAHVRRARRPGAVWIDLLVISILSHLVAGCFAMMGSSFEFFDEVDDYSGQTYAEAGERLWGEYFAGLEEIRLTIPDSGSYFIANPADSTAWIVTVGDLAPRKAHFVRDIAVFRARWEKGGRARELQWTVVFRGLDKKPLILPTPQYLYSSQPTSSEPADSESLP